MGIRRRMGDARGGAGDLGGEGVLREYLCIGRIVKPQGIKGEVKVQPTTDDPARFRGAGRIFFDAAGERPARVVSARVDVKGVYLRLEGVDDRNAAEALRGAELYVARADAIPLPEGRYFIADLIGLRVEDERGEPLGELADVTQAGGNDVYSVRGARGFLFPAVKRAIGRIDIEGGVMVLRSEVLAEIAVYDDEN